MKGFIKNLIRGIVDTSISIPFLRRLIERAVRFTPAGWKNVTDYLGTLAPAARDKMDMTSLLRGLIGVGATIRGVAIRGRWGEADTAEDLALYQEDYNRGLIQFPEKNQTS